ncbi:uncharacterized protein LODBEIA_P07750 [Lodderomyces beijingensis]|uniref:F-box domain-containing protein n=1 Tax=Lodderomyces beijingensis TaxID=1775926 RepID=A0ABP0ZEG7_9ASCO
MDKVRYSINTPIGYSKSPVQLLRKTFPYTPNLSASSAIANHSELNATDVDHAAVVFKLEKLPVEVLELVVAQLSQFDCLSLMRAGSKKILALCQHRLYRNLEIDTNFNIFDTELSTVDKTYINSAFNLKKFLNVFNKLPVVPHVYSFKCINLPDSLNIYDHDLNSSITRLFTRLEHLQTLVWLNDNFRLDYLYSLPAKEKVTTLILNIKFSNYPKELNNNGNAGDPGYRAANIADEDFSSLKFPNLKNFQIKPFVNSAKLLKLVNNFLINSNDAALVSNNLESLAFTGSRQFISNGRVDRRDSQYGWEIYNIFNKSQLERLTNLTCLSLSDLPFTDKEGLSLKKYIDLSKLKFLELRSGKAWASSSNGGGGRLKKTLMSVITPCLRDLQELSLHVPMERKELLNIIQSVPLLKSLDLTVYVEDPYEDDIDDVGGNTDGYGWDADSIPLFMDSVTDEIQKRHRRTLMKLAIKTNPTCMFEGGKAGHVETMQEFYANLQTLNLSRLSMEAYPNNSEPGRDFLGELLETQKNLEFLELKGPGQGWTPNLGLGMVHPTVFDKWYKVQHVALYYLKFNGNIKYISVDNECLFQNNSTSASELSVMPRNDGLRGWFQSQVRCEATLGQ